MTLPSAIMDSMFAYFDATDLARLAQVNKAWRAIIYRKSVWTDRYWSLRREHGVIVDKIPRDARHVGKPNTLCFVTWLTRALEPSGETLPIHLLHIADPAKFISEARVYWNVRRCPCVMMDHHEPIDLLTMRFPKSMSITERKRILIRLIKPSVRNLSRDAHEYSRYLQHMVCSSRGSIWDILRPHHALNPDDKDSDDPLIRYGYASKRLLADRHDAVNAYKERVYAAYTASITALRTHGLSEFTRNDTAYEKDCDTAWTHAALKL